MARINIEDCWWTDPRRSLLASKINSEGLADGTILRAWRLAQEFWKNNKGLIPKDLFETLPFYQEVIDSKLADVRGSFVYVRGSSAYLDWVREQRDQAREAGKKSAKARKAKFGSAQPSSKSSSDNKQNAERLPNDSRTKSNDAEPSVSVSSSYSDSDSNSDFGSKKGATSNNKTPVKESRRPKASAPEGTQSVISRYCELWKGRYGSNPPVRGKDSGLIKSLVNDFGVYKSTQFVEAYLEMPDTWFVTKRHDIPTLLGNLPAIVQFMETGRIFTKKEISNLDSTNSLRNTLEAIERGEI